MDVARRLRAAFRAVVVAQGVLEPATRPCGATLSLPHAWALLELLQATAPPTVGELARALHIDRSNVSRLCQRMARDDELHRVRDPHDGRLRRLQLTEHGRELAHHVDESSAAHFRRAVAALGDDAEDVIAALLRFCDAVSDETDRTHTSPRRDTT